MNKTYINRVKRSIYGEYCAGASKRYLSYKYHWDISDIKYLINLIDLHGIDILDNNPVKYSKEIKLEAIERVLVNGESKRQVCLDIGIPDTKILRNWIQLFKEKGYNMFNKNVLGEPVNKNEKDKMKKLEEENEYLRAEVAYLKKYNALVAAKEKQAQIKKSQTSKKR